MLSSNTRHTLLCLLSWQCTYKPSLKSCQIKEGCSFTLRAFTHTHPPDTPPSSHNAGGKITCAAVYSHYDQQRGSEPKARWILLLDAIITPSLSCLSARHFGGGPTGAPTLRFHQRCPRPSPFVIFPWCLSNDFLCTPFLFFCPQARLSLPLAPFVRWTSAPSRSIHSSEATSASFWVWFWGFVLLTHWILSKMLHFWGLNAPRCILITQVNIMGLIQVEHLSKFSYWAVLEPITMEGNYRLW